MSWTYQEELPGGSYAVKEAPRQPECGEDFCDTCGDCLACHGEDRCAHNSDGDHLWVKYLDDETA